MSYIDIKLITLILLIFTYTLLLKTCTKVLTLSPVWGLSWWKLFYQQIWNWNQLKSIAHTEKWFLKLLGGNARSVHFRAHWWLSSRAVPLKIQIFPSTSPGLLSQILWCWGPGAQIFQNSTSDGDTQVGLRATTHFCGRNAGYPAVSLAFRQGLVTEFWPMEHGQKWCAAHAGVAP